MVSWHVFFDGSWNSYIYLFAGTSEIKVENAEGLVRQRDNRHKCEWCELDNTIRSVFLVSVYWKVCTFATECSKMYDTRCSHWSAYHTLWLRDFSCRLKTSCKTLLSYNIEKTYRKCRLVYYNIVLRTYQAVWDFFMIVLNITLENNLKKIRTLV